MLQNIHIKNVILIDEIEVEFAAGYTALTGETGAGKSIILSALGLLLGKMSALQTLAFVHEAAALGAADVLSINPLVQ